AVPRPLREDLQDEVLHVAPAGARPLAEAPPAPAVPVAPGAAMSHADHRLPLMRALNPDEEAARPPVSRYRYSIAIYRLVKRPGRPKSCRPPCPERPGDACQRCDQAPQAGLL